jgi:hypothetical protein
VFTEAIFSPLAVTMAPFADRVSDFFVVSDFLKQKFLFADNDHESIFSITTPIFSPFSGTTCPIFLKYPISASKNRTLQKNRTLYGDRKKIKMGVVITNIDS